MIKSRVKYLVALAIFFLAVCLTATGNSIIVPNSPDSSKQLADSVNNAIIPSDTTVSNQPDTIISYFAENIRYFVKDSTEILLLETRAILKYKNITLSADTISLDLKTKKVQAHYSIDTLYADGLTRLKDTVIVVGLPTMQEGNDVVTGAVISYDLNTREGRVENSKSIMQNSNPVDNVYFQAEKLIKLDDNSLNGLGAKFTSCDKEVPDYYFLTDSVIVTKDDWVFAKPIYLYFGEVPVAYFPFAMYKKNSGRHSGLIVPSYYYSSQKGNALRHMGYFWDISPYVDYTITGDYYDSYGYIIDQNVRYNQKYVLNGNFNAIFLNDHVTHSWHLLGNHQQEITPTTHLSASLDYVSNTSVVRKTGETAKDRMQNVLSSSAYFNKRWEANGDYLTATASLTQFVDTAITNYTFPSLSMSLANRKPFQNRKNWPLVARAISAGNAFSIDRNVNHQKALGQYTDKTAFSMNFNENTKYNNFTLDSKQNFSGNFFETMVKNTIVDAENSYAIQRRDSSDFSKALTTSTGLSYNHSLGRFVKVEERLSYRHDLAFKYTDENGKIINGLANRQTYDFSTRANTWIYGVFNTPLGSLQKIRHTIAPSASYTYAPNFSKKEYGYIHYKETTDSTGNITVTKIDKFASSGIGGTPANEVSQINYTLSNTVEAKILTEGRETNNRTLFTLNFGGNYNFLADDKNFSDITAAFGSTLYQGQLIGKYAGLTLNSTANALIDPYNSYFKTYDYGYTVNIPIGFDGKINRDFFQQFVEPDSAEAKKKQLVLKEKSELDFTDMELKLNSSLYFSERYNHLHDYSKSFYMDLGITLKPTQNWSIEYQSSLNFLQPQIVTGTTISVYRDLHCWEGRFDWDLYNQGFKLLISTKSSIFKDLKFDKDTQKSRW